MGLSLVPLTWRALMRRKVFTAISLFGISCTLATLTVVAALLDDSFGFRRPDPDPSTTLGVYTLRLASEHSTMTGDPGYLFIDKYVRRLTVPKRVALYSSWRVTSIYQGERKLDVYLKRCDAAYWELTNFQFLAGGPFGAEDDSSGRRVAVINESTGRRLFGAGVALGGSFELEGASYRVVGVVPDVSFARKSTFADVWVPVGTAPNSAFRQQFAGGFDALVQLRSAADREAARSELANMLKQISLPNDFTEIQTGLDTRFEEFSREALSVDYRESKPKLLLGIIFALAIAFMVLPAVNLANLSMSRMLERASEVGVRKAFGATAGRLIVQLLGENLLLTTLGALISMPLAFATLALINRSGVIPYAALQINVRVVLWSILAAIVFGLLSGIYPAWRLAQLQPASAMRGRLR